MPETSTEENKEVVRRHVEALNERDRDAYFETLAEDFEFTSLGLDREEYGESEFAFYGAFSDLSYTLDELIAEDDLVVCEWTMQGTHDGKGGPGPLQHVEPAHEEIVVTGINIVRIEDGRMVESRAEWDVFNLYIQLGVVDLPTE